MDDFVISNLQESRNEWCTRLVSIMSPLVIEGFRSIFNEAWKLCIDSDELNKYLMTFQELLVRIPKWNNEIISQERIRIIERSGCNYLEDLITCVHIIQLKVLTCIRVGNKQKQIDISVPKLDDFIHKVYINCARKIYRNVYLFENNINSLQQQKNNRELEIIVQESIMIAIRESIPTESIIRAYMDEAVEQEDEVIIEDVEPKPEVPINSEQTTIENMENNSGATNTEQTEEIKQEESKPELGIKNVDEDKVITTLTFNDVDSVLDETDKVNEIEAPKTIERLEELSTSRALERKLEEEEEQDDILNISNEDIHLTDFEDLSKQTTMMDNDVSLLGPIEEL
jgi:hypothetical protein